MENKAKLPYNAAVDKDAVIAAEDLVTCLTAADPVYYWSDLVKTFSSCLTLDTKVA